MRYREQRNIIESDSKEEAINIFQKEVEEKQKDGWQWMMHRKYISLKTDVPYGIEYTMSKWEGENN